MIASISVGIDRNTILEHVATQNMDMLQMTRAEERSGYVSLLFYSIDQLDRVIEKLTLMRARRAALLEAGAIHANQD